MVRHDVAGKIEPELRHLGKHGALLVYGVVKDHVEAADAVGRDQDQIVSDVVDLADFAFFDGLIFCHEFPPVLLMQR